MKKILLIGLLTNFWLASFGQTVTIVKGTVTEGDQLVITLTLDRAYSGGAFEINASFKDSTATGNGTDYNSNIQVIKFTGAPAINEIKTIAIQTIEDLMFEGEEVFNIEFTTNASGITISNPLIKCEINDDETINDVDKPMPKIDPLRFVKIEELRRPDVKPYTIWNDNQRAEFKKTSVGE